MRTRDRRSGILPFISTYFPNQTLLSGLDNSKAGVIICDRRFRYKAVNRRVAEIHNVPMEGLLGHSFQQTLGSIAEKVVPFWENVFATGQPLAKVDVIGKLPKRSDEAHWIESLFPLMDNRGRITQIGGIVIEVSPPPMAISSSTSLAGKTVTANQPSDPDIRQRSLLSQREKEVLRLVAEGKSNKEISSLLGIGVRTVETYRSRLMIKLQATSIVHLVHYAIRNRILTL